MARRRLKPKWHIIIPALLILVLIIVLLIYLFSFVLGLIVSASNPNNKKYCAKNSIKIVNKLASKQYEKSETIGDVFFYGTSLIITSQKYDAIDKFNSYQGKKVKLVNICDNKEYNFTLGNEFDDFIPTNKLEPGIYEVYLVNNGVDYRLKMDPSQTLSTYGISQQNIANLIEVFSDKNYFKEIGSTAVLKDDYMFIRVTKGELPAAVYDIVIDAGFNEPDDTTESKLIFRDNPEAELLFKAANELADELKKMGYKVLVTRKSLDDEMATYGLDGRVHRTVVARAKLYLSLTFGKNTDQAMNGAMIIRSFYASDKFSEAVYQSLSKEEIVFMQNPVRPSQRTRDYDNEIDLREIGGTALQAGTFSQRTENENGSFVKTAYGINGITIVLGQTPNSKDMESFKANYGKWVKALAKGIDDYIKR